MKQRININSVVNETINEFGNVKVVCRLNNILENLGLNLSELADITGIRYASLHELANNKKVTLNLQHTLAIMVALRVPSFDSLFEIQFEDGEREAEYKEEVYQVHEAQQGLPDYVLNRRQVNKQRVSEWKTEYKKTLE